VEAKASYSFKKEERLCGKTLIETLLAKGKHGNVPGMRYLVRKNTGCGHARILISVPKKIFKRAVKRNLCKRRIREAWRKQKHMLCSENGIDILFMYSSKEILTYDEIYTAIGQIIEKINGAKPQTKTDAQDQ
jgi:ribonuclease P protein component